jgi:hypothetical protein
MSAFVVVHPLHVSSQDTLVDLGVRQVELVQLVPLYEQERAWLNAGGQQHRESEHLPEVAVGMFDAGNGAGLPHSTRLLGPLALQNHGKVVRRKPAKWA